MQDKSYDFVKIRLRFERVAEKKGMSPSGLASEMGLQNVLAQFFRPEQGRKVSTLANKLYERYGINPDWFLRGEGPERIADIIGRDDESLRYEEIGRLACELLRKAAEAGAFSGVPGLVSNLRQSEGAVIPPPQQNAGPSPSKEDVERWQCQQGTASPERRS